MTSRAPILCQALIFVLRYIACIVFSEPPFGVGIIIISIALFLQLEKLGLRGVKQLA